MEERMQDTVEPREKKPYVEPKLDKAQKLEDVTEGQAPVVTGAVVD